MIPKYIQDMDDDEFLACLGDYGDAHHFIHEAARRIRIYRALRERQMFQLALELIEKDPHQWSNLPCPTCRTISTIVGSPFGCETRRRGKGEEGG